VFALRVRRGGGSGRANIGDEIGDGEIGFVAYSGDYGISEAEMARANFFLVEGPEIFERARRRGRGSEHRPFFAIEELHGASDFGGRAIALDAHRVDGEVYIAEAPAQDADHIADSGSARRSDQADAVWQKRQRLFSISGEEAFGLEALLELLESELQGTSPTGSIFST